MLWSYLHWELLYVTFKELYNSSSDSNKVVFDGGALFICNESNVFFEESCSVSFSNNNAQFYGGALSLWFDFNATLEEDTHVLFYENFPKNNGGVYVAGINPLLQSKQILQQHVIILKL